MNPDLEEALARFKEGHEGDLAVIGDALIKRAAENFLDGDPMMMGVIIAMLDREGHTEIAERLVEIFAGLGDRRPR